MITSIQEKYLTNPNIRDKSAQARNRMELPHPDEGRLQKTKQNKNYGSLKYVHTFFDAPLKCEPYPPRLGVGWT